MLKKEVIENEEEFLKSSYHFWDAICSVCCWPSSWFNTGQSVSQYDKDHSAHTYTKQERMSGG